MVSSLLRSKEGQEWLMKAAFAGMRAASSFVRASPIDNDRWPLYVYYMDGKAKFIPRTTFCWKQPVGPSDSVWIVPGTWKND